MLSRPPRFDRDEQGFTLIELLVAVLILGIIGAITVTSLVRGLQVSNDADNRIAASAELSTAAERTTRELRVACVVLEATSSRAVVDVSRGGERLRHTFEIVGGTYTITVARVVGTVVTPLRTEQLIEDAALPAGTNLFTWVDGAGAPATTTGDIRDVTLALGRTTFDGDLVTSTTDIHLRNGGSSCDF